MKKHLPVLPGLIFLLTGAALYGLVLAISSNLPGNREWAQMLNYSLVHMVALSAAFGCLGAVWIIVAGIAKLIGGNGSGAEVAK
jgi:hypothetical protein